MSTAASTARWPTSDAVATYDEKGPPGATRPEPLVDNVPTPPALGRSFRSGSPDKAAGGDGIGSSVFKAAPRALARLYHPLCAKVALQGPEPLLWQHGIAVGTPPSLARPAATQGQPARLS